MGWWSTTSDQTYSYNMVLSFSNEPSSRVHDLHGEITLEGSETIDDARDRIIAQYVKDKRQLRRADVFVVSFSYR